MKVRWLLLCIVALAVLSECSSGRPTLTQLTDTNCTFTVNPNGAQAGTYRTVEAALAALPSDTTSACPTISIAHGEILAVVRIDITANSELTGDGNVGVTLNTTGLLLQIVGAASQTSIFDGASTARIFSVVGTGILQLSSLTLQNGFGDSGGCVSVSEEVQELALWNVFVAGCHSQQSGGALSFASTGYLAITGAVFGANTAALGDGGAIAISQGAALLINNTDFYENKALAGLGGSIWMTTGSSIAEIENSVFSDNAATTGGALAIDFPRLSSVSLSNCQLMGNEALSATAKGGAVFAHSSISPRAATLLVNNCSFSGNAARLVTTNSSSSSGNANARATATSTADDDDGADEEEGGGGAIAVTGFIELSVIASSFSSNQALGSCSSWGGAVLAEDGGASVTIWSSMFVVNEALGQGDDVAIRTNPNNPYFVLRGLNAYNTEFVGTTSTITTSSGCAQRTSGSDSAATLVYQDGSSFSPFFRSYACPTNQGCPYDTIARLDEDCSCFYGTPPDATSTRTLYWSTGQFVGAGLGAAAIALVIIAVPAFVAFFWKRKNDKQNTTKLTSSDVLNIQRATSEHHTEPLSFHQTPSMVSVAIAKTPLNEPKYILLNDSDSDSTAESQADSVEDFDDE